jgi:hypothetical protein
MAMTLFPFTIAPLIPVLTRQRSLSPPYPSDLPKFSIPIVATRRENERGEILSNHPAFYDPTAIVASIPFIAETHHDPLSKSKYDQSRHDEH